ncbi:phage Gp37/Gp68 family protein [uncultured Martelella sp.]|uniref:DUF5131 family protein n=1 Tax=uncultured Martelella sp. TaxID=392331 RepID=UPI0029C73882|nr:phage Gp37/Gp68 family protein [uncultured Martelella sp.]
MADNTKIEWTDATWNIVTGCSVVSPGCTNCYAMKLAGTRLKHHESRKGLTRNSKSGPVWTGDVRFNEQWLTQPLTWKRPRRIFVCAHGDLFAEGVEDEWLDRIFAVMALCPQHTFQVLTKRPERMRDYLRDVDALALRIQDVVDNMEPDGIWKFADHEPWIADDNWPLPNVWLGVSVEDQKRAEARIPALLDTPAALRWISAEPLLGPIDWRRWLPTGRTDRRLDGTAFFASMYFMTRCEYCGWTGSSELCGVDSFGDDSDVYCAHCQRSIMADELPTLDWIVAGGESGPDARPMHPDWIRSLRDQCKAAGVPFNFKQWGEWKHGSDFALDAKVVTLDGRTLEPALDALAAEHREAPFDRGTMMRKVGKKAAGRLLDGALHDAFPEVRS